MMSEQDSARLKLDRFMPYLLSITSNAVSDHIAEIYRKRFGLKIPEWRLLAILGERDSATQRELVIATLMDKVTVNRATRTLAERGLIDRAPNVADGRSHHLALTQAGRSLYEEIVPAALAEEARLLDTFSEAERTVLAQLLERLRQGTKG